MSQYSDRRLQANNDSEEQMETTSKGKNPAMEGKEDTPRKNLLKEKENKLLERSIIKANKEAIRRLREQRIQLLQSCTLSSDSEGETKQFDIEEMDRQWQEESNRTTLVLETIYDNLRMRNAINAYKNTSIVKNKDGEQLYKVTTIIMTEKLSKQANDGTKLKGTVEIKDNKCEVNTNTVKRKETPYKT